MTRQGKLKSLGLVARNNAPTVRILLTLAAAFTLTFMFLRLAGEVGEGETIEFDRHFLLLAQSVRAAHTWVPEVMRDLSGLGSTVTLTLITVSAVSYLLWFSRKRIALLLAMSILSGTGLVSLFKAAFGRTRPDAAYSDFVVSGWSFPSGHASMAAIVFLSLGVLTASTRPKRAEKTFILLIAVVLTTLVGLSRIALGVHYATDVLGGWAFGTAWAIAWLLIANAYAGSD